MSPRHFIPPPTLDMETVENAEGAAERLAQQALAAADIELARAFRSVRDAVDTLLFMLEARAREGREPREPG
jgi:hypothetical protein